MKNIIFLLLLSLIFACQEGKQNKHVFNGLVFESDTTFSLIGDLSSRNLKEFKDDTILKYNSNKETFEISSFFEGKKMGEEIIYKESHISNYLYRDLEQNILFVVNYDSLKNILSIDGHGIPEKYLSKDSVEIDSIVEINLILAAPPFFKRKFIYGICDENRAFTTKDSIDLDDSQTSIDILMKFQTSGKYNWQTELVYYSSKDTFSYKSLSIINVAGDKKGEQSMKIKKDIYGRSLYSFVSKLEE